MACIRRRLEKLSYLSALGPILLLLSNLTLALLPDAKDSYINDFANLMSAEDEVQLREVLETLKYRSGQEVTVVTITSFSKYESQYATWESFATSLFNDWGVGRLPDNNGIMLLVARDGNKIRIELGTGYPDRYDGIMQIVIDSVIYPSFVKGNYSKGILVGTKKIVDATSHPPTWVEIYRWYISFGFAAVVSTLIALSIRNNKSVSWFWVSLALLGFLILAVFSVARYIENSDAFGGGDSDGGGASGGD